MQLDLSLGKLVSRAATRQYKKDFGVDRKILSCQLNYVLAILPNGSQIYLPRGTKLEIKF